MSCKKVEVRLAQMNGGGVDGRKDQIFARAIEAAGDDGWDQYIAYVGVLLKEEDYIPQYDNFDPRLGPQLKAHGRSPEGNRGVQDSTTASCIPSPGIHGPRRAGSSIRDIFPSDRLQCDAGIRAAGRAVGEYPLLCRSARQQDRSSRFKNRRSRFRSFRS